MKNTRLTHKSDQGIALIIVILMLTLIVGLMLAMFSLSDSELRSARSFSQGQQAKQLADVAVNAVISQIRLGSAQDPDNNGRETWTSQPGLVRKYTENGSLLKAYKLYSSGQMVVPGSAASTLLSDVAPADWSSHPERYVDVNRPAFAPGNGGAASLRFPIIDPRAMTGGPNTVGGFSYSDKTVNGKTIGGVVAAGGAAQRLPMPVEWLYVLKDGALGALNGLGHFQGAGTPSTDNPIVGRIAFWTDDESSKVNINTASEPTTWALPTFFSDTDAAYAKYQPANGEFQRYPGHPATTALSPILFPGRVLSVADKDDIYNLVPKIGPGGTRSATVAYNDPLVKPVNLAAFHSEHLYADLDELLLKDNRKPNMLGGVPLTEPDVQKLNFFLTAHSRAPELNPFGQPKIAMWPLSYRGTAYQTSFDQAIAYCSTLRAGGTPRQYMFQRGWADSPTADLQRPENLAILNYLLTSLGRPIPGFAPNDLQTFAGKYGDDLPQLVAEFFDYVRSTNLHDSNLIKPGDKIIPDNTTQNFMLGYASSSARAVNFKTFTDPRFFAADPDADTPDSDGLTELLGYPGHGQVTPSRMTYNEKAYQGIARFPTISEAGLHFICCADNTDDASNPYEERYADIGKPGGARAPMLGTGDIASPLPTDFWYSNFPPRPSPNPANGDKPNLTRYPLTGGYPYGTDKKHPGYLKKYWNHQLTENTPLKPGFRRVQARFLFEFFIPAAGYTIIEPDISVKVSGLSKFKVGGRQLFPHDSEIIRSGRRATHPGADESGGYGLGLKGLLRGREAPARSPMPADKAWGNYEWQVKPTALPGDDLSVLNYDLLSNYVDIEVGRDGSNPMGITSADVQLEIYSGHIGRIASKDESPPALVQTLTMNFPANNVKAPTLVRNPIQVSGTQPAVEPPSWWTFHSRGCMGLNVDTLVGTDKKAPVADATLRGRYFNHNVAPRIGNEPRRGCFFYGFDASDAGAPRLFRPRHTSGGSKEEIESAEEAEGSDVVQTVTLKQGDPRLTAALPVVGTEYWHQQRYYGQRRLAHTFSNYVSNHMPGYDYGGTKDLSDRLVPDASYSNDRMPKLPYFAEAKASSQLYGDFDNGPGQSRDGPYINKPDEGNLSTKNGVAYLGDAGGHVTVGETFFSPSRMVPSPVMFGSLPSGVKSNQAWRTLLFRPQQNHPGGPAKSGGIDPADHLLLEFFWMPVVEPYAISEPLATAGKINLNYQIFPFTNIRRASGIQAVLTDTDIAAIPNEDAPNYKDLPNAAIPDVFWSKDLGKIWHYKVDLEKTLAQFENRFSTGEAFISPSEICDIHLVPKDAGISGDKDKIAADMAAFWSQHRLTGDNTRERPYSTIYPRVTTRSNTFRVHYVAQALVKARSTAVDEVGPQDEVYGEYRGSALIERYLDPTDATLPDFPALDATASGSLTLDSYYRFRVSENRKFGS